MTINLSDRALLTSVTISCWTARKLDKRVTSELTAKHGTKEGMARVNKLLIPKDSALDKVQTQAGAIRTSYYAQTLPWAVDGSRILPSAIYLGFAQEMRKEIDKFYRLRDAFVADYPQLREDARRLLNGMFNDADYPTPDEVERKFSADISFFPIPEGKDFRRTMLKEEAEAREKEIEETYKRVTAKAMRECWQRLHDVIERAAERLSKPDAVFRDSLVENARELCGLLPGLNIADDPNLEAMRHELERSLCSYNPDTLRRDPRVRAEVSSKLDDIMSKMGAFMGMPS